jgi:hypothetical protein
MSERTMVAGADEEKRVALVAGACLPSGGYALLWAERTRVECACGCARAGKTEAVNGRSEVETYSDWEKAKNGWVLPTG